MELRRNIFGGTKESPVIEIPKGTRWADGQKMWLVENLTRKEKQSSTCIYSCFILLKKIRKAAGNSLSATRSIGRSCNSFWMSATMIYCCHSNRIFSASWTSDVSVRWTEKLTHEKSWKISAYDIPLFGTVFCRQHLSSIRRSWTESLLYIYTYVKPNAWFVYSASKSTIRIRLKWNSAHICILYIHAYVLLAFQEWINASAVSRETRLFCWMIFGIL